MVLKSALYWIKRFLEHRYLPVFLALGAVLVMLPAVNTGFMGDDLPQRVIQFRPGQLPPNIRDTGNPADSGSFATVLRDLFFNRSPQDMARMKNYGMLPWWTADNLRFGLWRPVTAFTHWLDYRLFPDSPALMHLHNIAWFAAILFALTHIYRKFMGPAWPAGLAALLFLLDGNTFFPVAFIANRGFILSLFCGLMCLYEHHQWRAEKSRAGLWLSLLFLALAVLANEGGVSTFAFILAYALVLESRCEKHPSSDASPRKDAGNVSPSPRFAESAEQNGERAGVRCFVPPSFTHPLEPGSLRSRALTVLPSVLVIVLWRIGYALAGFGPYHVGAYIDPSHEPLQFARELIPRGLVMLAGQIPFLSPDLLFAVKPSLRPDITAIYCLLAVLFVLVFVPWVRRDKIAGFWFAAMLFAVIPASTVVPVTKNMGFVAVCAYGLIARFVAGLLARPINWPAFRPYRRLAWTACVILLLAHVPGAIAGRIIASSAITFGFKGINYLCDFGDVPGAENKNVIVINAPCQYLLAAAPFYKVYHHQPLPKSMRLLAPGCTSLNIERTDDRTLVIQSQGPDIFSCDDKGLFNIGYAFQGFNLAVCKPMCRQGERYDLGCVNVEVLQVDSANLPSLVAFHFNAPLESTNFEWLRFDWRTFSYQPFAVPALGHTITLVRPSKQLGDKPQS